MRCRPGMRWQGVEALPYGEARRTGGPWSPRERLVAGAWLGGVRVHVQEGAGCSTKEQDATACGHVWF